MNKLLPRNLIVAAALFGIAAESAWSEEAKSTAPAESVPAEPAEQATSSETGAAPGYAPTPFRRAYEQTWQPSQWPAPPPGYYGHPQPYYPPYRQYRPAPAANPLSAELKQTQDQLAAKTSELDTANEQLATLQAEQEATTEALQQAKKQLAVKNTELSAANAQLATLQTEQRATREALQQAKKQLAVKNTELSTASKQLATLQTEQQATREALQQAKEQLAAKNTELSTDSEQLANLQAEQQAIREVMQQAHSETARGSEQLMVVLEEMDILNDVLSKLKARLDVQNTSLHGALEAAAAEDDKSGSAFAGDAEQVQSPATPSAQPGSAGSGQTEVRDNDAATPEAEQEN